MTMRFLSFLLVAVALLLAPVGMRSGAAMAMPAKMEMAEKHSHCAGSETPGEDGGSAERAISCVALCSALAGADESAARPAPATCAWLEAKPLNALFGIEPGQDPPPPRLA